MLKLYDNSTAASFQTCCYPEESCYLFCGSASICNYTGVIAAELYVATDKPFWYIGKGGIGHYYKETLHSLVA